VDAVPGTAVRSPLPARRAAGQSVEFRLVKTYSVTTFGCQMNVHDSERIKGLLESLGLGEAAEPAQADFLVFNTCTIREKADDRFVAHLMDARAAKRRDPSKVIVVGGCWSESMKDELFELYPFVDLAFGPGNIHRLGDFIEAGGAVARGHFSTFDAFAGDLPLKRDREHQAWLQISTGCNCNCAYCIVPSVRGREHSRHPDELVREAALLAADGVRELTLLGQNVNSYGRDLRPQVEASFAGLLRALDGVDGIQRIRFTSPHPKDMRDDVIAAMAESPSVCEHLHLPVQSGSTRVLKAMRRTYSRERYLALVERIRAAIPEVALTTDIIVGFPGETEGDFADTLSLVDAVAYDHAFTFVYSPRRGTEAARMPDQVPDDVKRERIQRLVDRVQEHAARHNAALVGRTVEVLVEGPSRTDPAVLRGRTRTNKAVNFTGDAPAGSLVDVEVTQATSQTLAGHQRSTVAA
jgi:tRNA-2-methylthio-N6-dimethylallyladenosine synthase